MFKEDFPIFQKDIVFLDTAASAQKPECVLSALTDFYKNSYANVHRGSCDIATNATLLYENARKEIASFINAKPKELVFTKGTTESINLVASGYAQFLTKEDEVLICVAEHHANFVPWQQVCQKTGATFKVFNVKKDGSWDMQDFEQKLSSKTKIVAVAMISNVLGLLNPVQELIEKSHKVGAKVLLDGAQAVPHIKIDVKELDCDYLVFSGHKLYGPTGIGGLYGKSLELLPPYQFGGDMIKTVTIEKTDFADVPQRFEAGTPPFVEAVGLAEAVRYLKKISMDVVQKHEEKLTSYLIDKLKQIPQVVILGENKNKQGIVAFNLTGIHPTDVAFVLSKQNICVRVGHHCAMPIHHFFETELSVRVSLGLYNDEKDIDTFIKALEKTISLFIREK